MPHGRHAMGRRACSTVLDRGPHESGPPSTIASAVREVGPTRLDGRKGTEDHLSAFSILVTVTVSHNHWDHPDNWPGKLAKTVGAALQPHARRAQGADTQRKNGQRTGHSGRTTVFLVRPG